MSDNYGNNCLVKQEIKDEVKIEEAAEIDYEESMKVIEDTLAPGFTEDSPDRRATLEVTDEHASDEAEDIRRQPPRSKEGGQS